MNRLSRLPAQAAGQYRWASAGMLLCGALCWLSSVAAGPLPGQGGGGSSEAALPQTRIVGGQRAIQNAYPFMAALVLSDNPNPFFGQFCGASLVASDWVMTAAHCVLGVQPADVDVYIGSVNLLDNRGTRIPVQQIQVHPDYPVQGVPDVALLKLGSSFAATPVPLLAPSSGLEAAGTPVTVLGWGRLQESGSASNFLHQVGLNVVADADCRNVYGPNVNLSYEICAGVAQGGRDACFGDSGGPMLVRQNGVYKQLGIISGGAGCARPGIPGIYTRVPAITSWAASHLDGSPAGSQVVFDIDCLGTMCQFTAPQTDALGNALSNPIWRVDGGLAGTEPVLVRDFAAPGNYAVALQQTDSLGKSLSVTVRVNIGVNDNLGVGLFSASSVPRVVDLQGADNDSVFILGVPGSNEADPGGWRMRPAQEAGIRVRFQEWDYRSRQLGDNEHAWESAALLYADRGLYRMADGGIWQFGRTQLSGTGDWQRVDYPVSLPAGQTPRVFATVQSENAPQMVAVRLRNVDHRGFEAALFEEEGLMDGHAPETVGYVAIVAPAESSSLRIRGNDYDYRLTQVRLSHTPGDAAGVSAWLEEEQSSDSETAHAFENVDVLSSRGYLFAQPVSFHEADTCLPRRR